MLVLLRGLIGRVGEQPEEVWVSAIVIAGGVTDQPAAKKLVVDSGQTQVPIGVGRLESIQGAQVDELRWDWIARRPVPERRLAPGADAHDAVFELQIAQQPSQPLIACL